MTFMSPGAFLTQCPCCGSGAGLGAVTRAHRWPSWGYGIYSMETKGPSPTGARELRLPMESEERRHEHEGKKYPLIHPGEENGHGLISAAEEQG